MLRATRSGSDPRQGNRESSGSETVTSSNGPGSVTQGFGPQIMTASYIARFEAELKSPQGQAADLGFGPNEYPPA